MKPKSRAIISRLDELEKFRQSLEQRSLGDTPIPIIVESQTRDFLAKSVVVAFFGLLAIIIIGTPVYNAIVSTHINLSELLQQYSSILGPILGFVIGYYFKAKE